MNRQRILSNVLAMGMGQIATWVLSLLYFVALGRYLGPDRFGELALAKAIVAVLWLGVALGMELLITRAVARTPERTGVLTSAALLARLALSIPLLGALYVGTHVVHLNSDVSMAAYLYGVAEALWSLERVLLAVFQGHERMSLTSLSLTARNVLELALAFAVIWRHGGVVAIAATDIPIAVVLLAVNLHWMRRFGRVTVRVSRQVLHEVVIGGLAFWANDLFYTVYKYADSVLLAALAGTFAVGIYAPAVQLFTVPMFLIGIIGPATLPQLSRLGVAPAADFDRAGSRVLAVFVVCAVPLTVGLVTFAGPLMVTIFGPAYSASAPVLVVLSLAILPVYLNSQFSQILAASDRQRWWAAALVYACVVNPLLNLMLIPLAHHLWHNAALGSALAWLVTDILEVVYGMLLLPRTVLNRIVGRALLGALGAGAAQAAAIVAVGTIWLPLGEACGAAVYAVAAVLLGAIPRADVVFLLETALRPVRGRTARPRMAEAE